MLVGKKIKYELLYYIHIPTNRLNSKAKLLEGNWLVFVNYNDYKNNIHVSLPYLFSFLKIINEWYKYHCWIPLQKCLFHVFIFILHNINLLQRKCSCLKQAHTCNNDSKDDNFKWKSITCHGQTFFEKSNWLNREIVTMGRGTIYVCLLAVVFFWIIMNYKICRLDV